MKGNIVLGLLIAGLMSILTYFIIDEVTATQEVVCGKWMGFYENACVVKATGGISGRVSYAPPRRK